MYKIREIHQLESTWSPRSPASQMLGVLYDAFEQAVISGNG